ncbi:MAG: ATP-binding protein [Gemmatimonadaceae bacterium]
MPYHTALRFTMVALVHGGLSLLFGELLHAAEGSAVMWPSAGIALGLLLLWGGAYWPAVALGSAVCLHVHGAVAPLHAALGGAVAGSAAWVGATVITRCRLGVSKGALALQSVHDTVLLVLGCIIVAPLWSAAGMYLFAAMVPGLPFAATPSTAAIWWVGDALGTLAFTPLMIAWSQERERVERQSLEWTGFIGGAVVVTALLLLARVGRGSAFALFLFSCVPLILWSAKRFGVRITLTVTAALVLALSIGYASGQGLMARDAAVSGGNLWSLQLVIVFFLITGLVQSASVHERTLTMRHLRASEAAHKLAEQAARASEARWRSLIAATPQLIFLLDREGRILFLNRTVDGSPPHAALGTNVLASVIHASARERAAQVLQRVFDHAATGRLEVAAAGPRQSRVWYDCQIGPVMDQGRVETAILLASDVTGKKQADAARQQLEIQLYQSQKLEALGTLAGGIAHDFNNLLAGIMGNAELLRPVVADDPEASDSVHDILAAVRRAREVVRQILTFSRRQPLERRPTGLRNAVVEAMPLLRASLQDNVRLRTTIRSEDVIVLADDTQLHQVIMNLATNSAQAIGAAPGEIIIDVGTAEVSQSRTGPLADMQPGRYARLEVRDNGPGMEQAVRERVFEPFFTTKPIGQGTGLGLSVAHGIIASHGGTILVESEPGHGTTFTIYLPLHGEDAAAQSARGRLTRNVA